jgi:hypothetical protein
VVYLLCNARYKSFFKASTQSNVHSYGPIHRCSSFSVPFWLDITDDTIWPEPSPITWDDTVDEYFRQKIDSLIKTSRTSGPFKKFSRDVFKICHGFSFEETCKARLVTAGGAFQAGMQLALGKIAGRLMSVHEVVSIRWICRTKISIHLLRSSQRPSLVPTMLACLATHFLLTNDVWPTF